MDWIDVSAWLQQQTAAAQARGDDNAATGYAQAKLYLARLQRAEDHPHDISQQLRIAASFARLDRHSAWGDLMERAADALDREEKFSKTLTSSFGERWPKCGRVDTQE
jgi:hypothetical protein